MCKKKRATCFEWAKVAPLDGRISLCRDLNDFMKINVIFLLLDLMRWFILVCLGLEQQPHTTREVHLLISGEKKNIRFNNTSRSKSCDFQHVCLMYIIHFVMCSTASGSDFAFSFFCYSPCSFCSRIHAFIFCGVLFHLKRGFNKCRRWREALGFFSSQNTQRGGNNQQELTDFLESVWLERHKQQATGVRRRCL